MVLCLRGVNVHELIVTVFESSPFVMSGESDHVQFAPESSPSQCNKTEPEEQEANTPFQGLRNDCETTSTQPTQLTS